MPRKRTLVVGAGIAGAATAWFLARSGRREVWILEQEDLPDRHSTGRNAAILRTAISDPALHEIARLSAAWLAAPPQGFADGPLIRRTGLILAATEEAAASFRVWTRDPRCIRGGEAVDPAWIVERLPCFHDAGLAEAVFLAEEGVLDVHAIHQGFLAGARRAGARLLLRTRATRLLLGAAGVEGVEAGGEFLPASEVVLAAGGWGDRLARAAGLPLPLQPRRRHLLVTAPAPGIPAGAPVLWVAGREFYCRPESGGLLVCACDADPVQPETGEATREEALLRIAEVVEEWLPGLAQAGAGSFWAGMRTFAPDGRFVLGADPRARGLYWAAGLGGHGITCSAELGRRVAAEILGEGQAGEAFRPARLLTPQQAPQKRLATPDTATS